MMALQIMMLDLVEILRTPWTAINLSYGKGSPKRVKKACAQSYYSMNTDTQSTRSNRDRTVHMRAVTKRVKKSPQVALLVA
jgi:hypothetical protein